LSESLWHHHCIVVVGVVIGIITAVVIAVVVHVSALKLTTRDPGGAVVGQAG
jgi:hypothetical protein